MKRQIAENEVCEIYQYIGKKFRNELSFPTDKVKTRKLAKKDFLAITQSQSQSPKIDSQKLLEWSANYLTKNDWTRLKGTIRKRRSLGRKKLSGISHKNISLSKTAHRYLQKLSERNKLTLSQFIEEHLRQEYFEQIVLTNNKKKVVVVKN